MYYRIEARETGAPSAREWDGVYTVLDGTELSIASRGLHVPKALRKGLRNTKSYFTEYGWQKYSGRIFKAIRMHKSWCGMQYRIIAVKEENIPAERIVSRGKVQILENLD